ncbi:MAG: ATP-binding protein [Blastocatellia bacterium]
MKISTRLILHLTVVVSGVLIAASLLLLRQREQSLKTTAEDEVRIHAVTLQIALEEHYSANHAPDAQQLINRLRENTGIYSVLLFNVAGNVEFASHPNIPEEIRYLKEARQVIATGQKVEIESRLGGEDVFSVIMPVKVNNQPVKVLEIAQPISFVNAEIAQMRGEIVLIALLLCATIFLVVLAVTNYSLTRPIQDLLGGAAAMGRGELSHRVIVPRGGGELAELAQNFNRMAESLVAQRQQAEREAEARLALERKLRHSERLAAVGHLAAGVAHEMGAPLQVIDGRAKQLANHPATPAEPHQRNLAIIHNQTERITNIVRNLLNLSRTYDLRRRLVDLPNLLAETLELVQPNADHNGIQIETNTNGIRQIEADPNVLQQVFLNIFSNAIQAMFQGGRLRIECHETTHDELTLAAISIADTGSGIPPEHLETIFDPFFTTKEVGHGTGLGLAVSTRMVEEHGGWIEATNNSDGGATFTVFLPVRPASV